MIKKTLTIFGILATFLFGLSIISAASLSIDNIVIPSSISNSATSFQITFDLINSGAEADINWSNSTLTQGSGDFSFSHNHISSSQTLSITATLTIPAGQTGNIAGQIWADPSGGGNSKNLTFSVPIIQSTPTEFNFCEINGAVGDLEIKDVNFDNFGEGEDDDWFLLDEIEIEVEVENTHRTNNVKDVLVEVMILDEDENDVTSDFDFKDEEIDLNTIKDGDSETATFKINELPADLDSGSYKIYIKAYSEDDEDTQCAAESNDLNNDLYQRIDVTREDDPAVIIKEDEQKFSVSCGDENVIIPLNIYNLGSSKEKKVLVTLSNSELNIEESIVIDNLKSGKRKEVMFNLDVPEDIDEKIYKLKVRTHYDYDDDEDELDEFSYSENSFDDLDKDFAVRLEVLSCQGPAPTINANLESTAQVDSSLVIKTLVTNNGNDANFVFSISDFETWAEVISVSPQTASINKGEFQEITVTLKPTESGTQSFNIKAISEGETYSQPVSVNIAEKPGTFTNISDTALYIIVAIIAILILIFLVLIVRVSRKPPRAQF